MPSPNTIHPSVSQAQDKKQGRNQFDANIQWQARIMKKPNNFSHRTLTRHNSVQTTKLTTLSCLKRPTLRYTRMLCYLLLHIGRSNLLKEVISEVLIAFSRWRDELTKFLMMILKMLVIWKVKFGNTLCEAWKELTPCVNTAMLY